MSIPPAPDVWNTWCPPESIWAAWAKPLLFAVGGATPGTGPSIEPETPEALRHFDGGRPDTFVIVDMPNDRGVAVALGLAQIGFRPVPLYNGVPGWNSLVEVGAIQRALANASPSLAAMKLRPNAPPAFLLDANRMTGTPMPRAFDNRWVVIPEDFPSGARLLSHGLRRCVLVAQPAHTDLDHVLTRWAEAGITIESVAHDKLEPHVLTRPSGLISVFRRIAVQMGLRRSSAGGFGGLVPEPTSSGSG